MLWIVLLPMALLAVGFVVWPMLLGDRRRVAVAAASALFVVAGAGLLYAEYGNPGVPSGRAMTTPGGAMPDVESMVTSLAARLQSEPDDIAGWNMLGRSYMTLERYPAAVEAFERVIEIEAADNIERAESLVQLGEALVAAGGQSLTPRSVSLFENALALDPNHPTALFWGGLAAANTGNTPQAADRWESLLATNPPAEVAAVLRQRVMAWRGEPMPAAPATVTAEASGYVVNAAIDLSDAAKAALPAGTTIFVIARDPAQPSPPIAVVRRTADELPTNVTLSDGDAMIPGRNLSQFDELELIARASLSGNPAAAPGDWFGSVIVKPTDSADISLSIEERIE